MILNNFSSLVLCRHSPTPKAAAAIAVVALIAAVAEGRGAPSGCPAPFRGLGRLNSLGSRDQPVSGFCCSVWCMRRPLSQIASRTSVLLRHFSHLYAGHDCSPFSLSRSKSYPLLDVFIGAPSSRRRPAGWALFISAPLPSSSSSARC